MLMRHILCQWPHQWGAFFSQLTQLAPPSPHLRLGGGKWGLTLTGP